jgi:hypothetical protein
VWKFYKFYTFFALSSLMKITCYNALFAVTALTQLFLGQATVIVQEDVSISMNYPNGPPDVITPREQDFLQDVLLFTFNDAFNKDERELFAISGHFRDFGDDEEDGGDRRLQYISFRYRIPRARPFDSPLFRSKPTPPPVPKPTPPPVPKPKPPQRPFMEGPYVYTPPRVFVDGKWQTQYRGNVPVDNHPVAAVFTVGCDTCIRSVGHGGRNLRGTQQEESSPPRGRLLKENDDGKNIEAWAAAACEILSNSNIATFQNVNDCVIVLDN